MIRLFKSINPFCQIDHLLKYIMVDNRMSGHLQDGDSIENNFFRIMIWSIRDKDEAWYWLPGCRRHPLNIWILSLCYLLTSWEYHLSWCKECQGWTPLSDSQEAIVRSYLVLKLIRGRFYRSYFQSFLDLEDGWPSYWQGTWEFKNGELQWVLENDYCTVQ